MTDLTVRTLEVSTKSIPQDTVAALRGKLRGVVALPGEDGYDAARTIWNAMIDRRPGPRGALPGCRRRHPCGQARARRRAARCRARRRPQHRRQRGLRRRSPDRPVADEIGARRSCDPARRASSPARRWRDFDKEAQAFGLATPLGINSTTGVAGLTLGGGFGWTTRKFGLTIDNLLSADVVTADGKLVRASEKENPDLFWALRGGGGNFGVVTSFEFKLHPLGPEVLSGLIVHPFDAGAASCCRRSDASPTTRPTSSRPGS